MSDQPGKPDLPTGADLLEALRVLERRCRENAAGLPTREATPDVWAGVLFRVGDKDDEISIPAFFL